jgi:hypothetical protein
MRTKPIPCSPVAVVSLALSSVLVGLGGCSQLEAQLQRKAPPDRRIELAWQDRVSVRPRDVVNYTCQSGFRLMCEGGGAITLSCTCVLP